MCQSLQKHSLSTLDGVDFVEETFEDNYPFIYNVRVRYFIVRLKDAIAVARCHILSTVSVRTSIQRGH